MPPPFSGCSVPRSNLYYMRIPSLHLQLRRSFTCSSSTDMGRLFFPFPSPPLSPIWTCHVMPYWALVPVCNILSNLTQVAKLAHFSRVLFVWVFIAYVTSPAGRIHQLLLLYRPRARQLRTYRYRNPLPYILICFTVQDSNWLLHFQHGEVQLFRIYFCLHLCG